MSSTTLITGVSSGLGAYLAKYFVLNGHFVHGCSRNKITESSENFKHHTCDLKDPLQVKNFVKSVIDDRGKIDVLICNAGSVTSSVLYPMMSLEKGKSIFDDNFEVTTCITKEVVRQMIKKKYGRIIFISSTMASLNHPGTIFYSSAKAAIENMAVGLARELAPFNILVNIISPGLMTTPSSDALAEKEGWYDEVVELQDITKPIDLDEVARLSFFLTQESNNSITGQNIKMGLAG